MLDSPRNLHFLSTAMPLGSLPVPTVPEMTGFRDLAQAVVNHVLVGIKNTNLRCGCVHLDVLHVYRDSACLSEVWQYSSDWKVTRTNPWASRLIISPLAPEKGLYAPIAAGTVWPCPIKKMYVTMDKSVCKINKMQMPVSIRTWPDFTLISPKYKTETCLLLIRY